MFLDVSRTSLIYTDIFSRQIISILKIANVDESHPHERQISTTYNTFSRILYRHAGGFRYRYLAL